MNDAFDTLVDARVVAVQKSSYAVTKYGATVAKSARTADRPKASRNGMNTSYRVFDIESESQAGIGLVKFHIRRNAVFTQCSSLAYHSIFAIFPARLQRLVKSGHLGSLK
jgi:hypothetical protein